MAERSLFKVGGTQGNGTFDVVDVDGDPEVRINGVAAVFPAPEEPPASLPDPLVDPLQLPTFTVATEPAATPAGQLAYFSDGDAGDPCVAVSDGTNWLVLYGTDAGTPISDGE